MMGHSYGRVKEQAKLHATQLRAEVIIDMERRFSQKQLENKDWFPEYVQTLSPVEPEHCFEAGSDMERLDVSKPSCILMSNLLLISWMRVTAEASP